MHKFRTRYSIFALTVLAACSDDEPSGASTGTDTSFTTTSGTAGITSTTSSTWGSTGSTTSNETSSSGTSSGDTGNSTDLTTENSSGSSSTGDAEPCSEDQWHAVSGSLSLSTINGPVNLPLDDAQVLATHREGGAGNSGGCLRSMRLRMRAEGDCFVDIRTSSRLDEFDRMPSVSQSLEVGETCASATGLQKGLYTGAIIPNASSTLQLTTTQVPDPEMPSSCFSNLLSLDLEGEFHGANGTTLKLQSSGNLTTIAGLFESFSEPGECLPQCTDDEHCKGDRYCTATGQCAGCEECREDETCIDDTCVPDTCVPGSCDCQGNDLMRCKDDGSEWELEKACEDHKSCNAIDCVCSDNQCTPGDFECRSQELFACNKQGIWYRKDNCSSIEMCDENVGECVEIPNACDSNIAEFRCDNRDLYRCSTKQRWVFDRTCNENSECSTEKGECVPHLCDPRSNERRCIGSSVAKCNDLGDGWVIEDRCGKGNVSVECRLGRCVPDHVNFGNPTSWDTPNPNEYFGNIIELAEPQDLYGYDFYIRAPLEPSGPEQEYRLHWRVQRAIGKTTFNKSGEINGLEFQWTNDVFEETTTLGWFPGDEKWVRSPFTPHLGLSMSSPESEDFDLDFYLLALRIEAMSANEVPNLQIAQDREMVGHGVTNSATIGTIYTRYQFGKPTFYCKRWGDGRT